MFFLLIIFCKKRTFDSDTYDIKCCEIPKVIEGARLRQERKMDDLIGR